MTTHVKLNELDEAFAGLRFPIERETVATELHDVVLVYADGEEPLPDVLDRVGTQSFADRDELETEIYNVLPVEAVGEPGQSEGEG
ncbi:hypothetical protein SAMN05216559_4079 [Halomicrobium zhouii]|uniref:DUF2795 domain-containing protein n=1 Tax=Halomicrobium zhouii TaxID=767519 RepID=A0A1I6MA20_9EURY|nr:hypothetical protein [Halomicrobium zhouii]SFS12574.1 hypothetical protein SAMN05216559_4079 [Halomicrobium zhouii]